MSSPLSSINSDDSAAVELQAERYAEVLQSLRPSEVLAVVDELLAQLVDVRQHPLYAFVAHCLSYGTTMSSGKRPYLGDMIGAAYEPLIDEAIRRLVEDKIADVSMWEDELWKKTQS